MRRFQFSEGEKVFAEVQVGWTIKRLRAHLGAPTSCEAGVWSYKAGLEDGPLLIYRFSLKGGLVDRIEHSAAACIYRL